MEVAGFQATEACGSKQLVAALTVGHKGAIHATHKTLPTETWDDAPNDAPETRDGDANNSSAAPVDTTQAEDGPQTQDWADNKG